jgi:hypothetical protein
MSLNIVPIEKSILIEFKKQDIKTKIIERLQELKLNISLYKNDSDMLILITNLIEYLVLKKDSINKKELVILIYNELYGLTPEEIETLKNNIDIIHLQNKIKKPSYYKMFKAGFKEWFFKKK